MWPFDHCCCAVAEFNELRQCAKSWPEDFKLLKQVLGLLNSKTTDHADGMVLDDERKRLFRPEGSLFGLIYACEDGQVKDHTLPLGIGASCCIALYCLSRPAHAELAECAEGYRGTWCKQECMSLCRWIQPIEQGKLQTVRRCSVRHAQALRLASH